MSLHLRYAAISDRGVVRQGNQDSVFAGAHFIAVADGMGGMAAGDLASAIVINTVARLDVPPPADSVVDELADAVADANRAIRRCVADDPQKEGMGTTLTALWFDGEWFNLVHIGDSRAYRMREGAFEQITVDDTYVQMLVDEGRITAEEAERHPQRSLLLRALGASEVEPAFQTIKGVPGDRLLLCSDGLSGPVSDADIARTLQGAATPQEAAETLVQQALDAGAPDNVTVLVADVIADDPGEQRQLIGGAAADARLAESDTAVLRAVKEAEEPKADAEAETEEVQPKARKQGRVWRTILACLIVLTLAAGGGMWWVRTQYFIGVSDAGNISVYRGLPFEVAGYRVAWVEVDSGRAAEDAVDDVETELESGIRADGIEDAESRLGELVDPAPTNANLDPLCSSADTGADSVPAAASDCRED
ncbi:protein phosphatase 2C domain-containing protein [Glycomyces sp. TRM65418]|uniref:PP2C family protein-serine/threonine phosphatase n=1 Tax=Glycomyces sp. TRM65418 TaxID=2867006 RepID=UPI001CE4EAB9|nr:PP2C family serine/threonine-protein phosphatase [Glycomyces sp. TRM65418]MCC3762489.1 protein phosphatase 2C domain-containing protein [Glycomyces sp. TRM65418]QZD56532.1 protein phosphatase 2C domain-containing protein [Glycomyces sp. TRM65418]